MNHVIERLWVEINSRINYPIKRTLIRMSEVGALNIDNPSDRFCTSWYTLNVANVGVSLFISSWNEHRIPGEYIVYSSYCPDITPNYVYKSPSRSKCYISLLTYLMHIFVYKPIAAFTVSL